MAEIETGDIFRAAYLVCAGGELIDTVRDGRHVEFVISGTDLLDQDRRYLMGEALVNPLQLKEALNMLRDLIFKQDGTLRRHGRQNHGTAHGSRS